MLFWVLQLQDSRTRTIGSWHNSSVMFALRSTQHIAGNPSATCAIGLLTHRQTVQASCVLTWFFFYSDNNFLKFFNDDDDDDF